MVTTTSLKIGIDIDLRTQSSVFATNAILAVSFRVEAGRTEGGHYMIDHADNIEAATKIWLREQSLEKITLELYSPHTDTAYETCELPISYLADPKTEATKPPVAALEELFQKLEKLPADAQFRFLVQCAPGATKVPGWVSTQYKPLAGGVKEEHKVGTEYGYGHIQGSITYIVSNWDKVRGNA